MSDIKFAAIVLNGPARSGKDTLLKHLSVKGASVRSTLIVGMEFKEALIELAVRTSGVTRKLWDALYEREYKERPAPYFQVDGVNVSPRQWLIHLSETVAKPMFGEEFFGQVIADKMKIQMEAVADLGYDNVFFVFSDGGFPEEALPIIRLLGKDNYFVARLYRYDEDGEEYSFAGDSRNYLRPEHFTDECRPHIFDVINHEGKADECAAVILDGVLDLLEGGV